VPSLSELSLHQLIEALPDAVVTIDERGVIVLVNQQTEAMFGYQRSELVGYPIEILIPERSRGKHIQKRKDYFTAPQPRAMGIGLELTGRRKDGTEFPVEISLSPLQAQEGVFATSVIRDLSQRKRAEAKFRTLVENIPAVTFIAPLDESIPELYVSPQIEALLGFTKEEWLEDPVLWHRQLHPDDSARWNAEFAPTCNAGRPFRSVYRFIAKDGRVVWVHGAANIVRDSDGQPLFLQGVAFDVTAIKEAEAEREQFFSLSVALLCIAGLDGKFRRVNRAFTETLGYPMHELLSTPFLEFVHPDDREVTLAELDKLASGQSTNDFENRYRCRDGTYKWLHWAATPYLPRQVIFAVGRDVTQQRQAEEALIQANTRLDLHVKERTRELEEMVKELKQFRYVASHDLKNWLRAINYPRDSLLEDYADQMNEGMREYLDQITAGTKGMEVLLAALQRYSEVLQGDRPLERIDCNQACQDACIAMRADIEEQQVIIDVMSLPILMGKRNDLVTLFQNLIGNAIKYRHPNRIPTLSIGVERETDAWRFHVRDNGLGIEENYRQKIFELGISSRQEPTIPGTGIGLSICERIVHGHGGRIWVESEYRKGSTFYFTLPLSEA